MGTVLFIKDSYCLSLRQLCEYFSMELIPGTPLYEDLLIAQRDGELAKWLCEGGTKEESDLCKKLCNLPSEIPNSELVNRMKLLFIGGGQSVQKPHFSSYIEFQQIRCMVNDVARDLEETSPRNFECYINRGCSVKFFVDFKVTKKDDEVFDVDFHGKHTLSLKEKSVGQVITIETSPYLFNLDKTFPLSIENETIGVITLKDYDWIINVRGVEIAMIYVEGGTFTMGATSEQGSDAYSREKPAHQVTLSSFSIGKYEVTQEEWEAVMGSNPSSFKGAKLPVENVSWDDCQAFIRKLNQLTGKKFRLPTEAEWEYAARGGNKSRGYKYAGGNDLDGVAWYTDNSNSKTHEVGQKQPNELGLYDMSASVCEWCEDWGGDYSSSYQMNPFGPSTGSLRVNRGGGWSSIARRCRVSLRDYSMPGIRDNHLGLRLAL